MFGEKLKELRSNNKLTQQEIADILKVSASTIGMYEQGRRSPDTGTLNRVAEHFDVSVDWLLGRPSVSNYKENKKEDNDISTTLDRMKKQLATSDSLMFDGQPATEEQVQAILNAIEMGEAFAKQRAKEKFTPKKYRK